MKEKDFTLNVFTIGQKYRQETITNLACVLTDNDEYHLSSSDMIMARTVAYKLIPWAKKHHIITKEEFVNIIKHYVVDHIKPYTGAENGYIQTMKIKWLVLAQLFGINAADSLINNEMNVEANVTYDKGQWSLQIPGMKQSNAGHFYNDKRLSWCRRMAPAVVSVMTDDIVIDVMAEAYYNYGQNECVQYWNVYYDKKDFKEIYALALESPIMKEPEFTSLTPDNVICQLQWSIQHAEDDMTKQLREDWKWNDLCNIMQEAWDSYLS